ncbi:hypothetical protein PYW08_016220 [Mythimna loreyi]|uniref:Uncharacterized protein n=1 Tax=Mythimna loreyi TaxID=667449 RepID=A0ACC2QYE8_9NEOP|nr:hypothetical protein PYW08_016220 [Mythimna loreyi]
MLQIIHFVCLSYLWLAPDVVRCKPAYLFSAEAGGWLNLHLMPATWEQAFLRCHYEGAVLASPINKELAKALLAGLGQLGEFSSIFLGIHDLYSNGHFASVEGVPLSDMEIEWRLFRPGINHGDCLSMSVDRDEYYIQRASCTDPLPFMCYRKYDNQTMNECGTFDNQYQLRRCTGSCYKVHQKLQSWSRAYGICSAEGGHLVILNDAEEARIVQDMFPTGTMVPFSDHFHVGLTTWSTDRIWTTIHGESLEDVFNKWSNDKPNLGFKQNRASFVSTGTLDVIDDDFKSMFVCEKSPTSLQYEPVPVPVREKNLGHLPVSDNNTVH